MLNDFVSTKDVEATHIVISADKGCYNKKAFKEEFPRGITLTIEKALEKARLLDIGKIIPLDGTITFHTLDDFFSDLKSGALLAEHLYIQDVKIKTEKKIMRNSAIVRGIDEYHDNDIVKRLFCDCCGAYYDYPLSLTNIDIDIEFICHPCENNVLEDLAKDPSTARNTIEELANMRTRIDHFNLDHECLLSECTDFYEQVEVSDQQIKDYINTGEFHD